MNETALVLLVEAAEPLWRPSACSTTRWLPGACPPT